MPSLNPLSIESLVINESSRETNIQCFCCHENINSFMTHTRADGEEICSNCYETEHFLCSDCDEIFPDSESNYDDENCFCNECYQDRQDNDLDNPDNWCDSVFSYSHKVHDDLGFLGNPTDKMFYGVELELATNVQSRSMYSYLASEVSDRLKGFAQLKSDQSITPGFEIVTAPATLEIHRERWKAFFDDYPSQLGKHGGTGMHVHVSRKPLSQLTIGKLLVFINASENRSFIVAIAGRDNDRWAGLNASKRVTDVKWANDDRYEALNLRNAQTIEFRIFEATLDESIFQARLEFVKAAIYFCLHTSLRHLLYSDFLNWLARQGDYPSLKTWVANNNGCWQ